MTIETLTEEERETLTTRGGGTCARVVRIIDKLTEALAAASDPMREQTWSERFRVLTERAEAAEAKLAAAERLADSRLKSFTDAYAAIEHLKATVVDKEIAYDMAASRAARAESSAETAEHARDAANALLRRIDDWQGPHGLTVTVMNDIKAHLSGQPAAPSRTGADSALQGARNVLRDLNPVPALEARVRELETHNASLRERNTELVHMRQVAESRVAEVESSRGEERVRHDARVRELEVFKEAHSEARRGYAERVAGLEDELAALRERVADARRKLTCPHRSAPTRVRDALEALRGN